MCDCPFCNPGGGGEVHRVIIPPANIRGFLCEGCDAFWLQEREIVSGPCYDFETYLSEFGVENPWKHVLFIPRAVDDNA